VAGRGKAAGVRARARAGGGSGGTATDRELAVVAAVIAAGSEKAAAHRLGLSHSTVKHHLANARSKVGATTTAQLVWILSRRLSDPDDPPHPDEQRSANGGTGLGSGAAEPGVAIASRSD
jgi:DNA-binding CsgD family transcriptional regulator